MIILAQLQLSSEDDCTFHFATGAEAAQLLLTCACQNLTNALRESIFNVQLPDFDKASWTMRRVTAPTLSNTIHISLTPCIYWG